MIKNWNVYLLKCADGTHYCGVTNNIEQRIAKHNNGKGAKYTRGRLPVRLLAVSKNMAQGEALSLEAKVKKGKGVMEKIKKVEE